MTEYENKVPLPDETAENQVEEKNVFPERILGPFEIILRFSGCDLTPRYRPFYVTVFVYCICVIIWFLCLIKMYITISEGFTPLTVRYMGACIKGSMTVLALATIEETARSTRKEFIGKFERQLGELRAKKGKSGVSDINPYPRLYKVLFIFGGTTLLTWIIMAANGYLYTDTEDWFITGNFDITLDIWNFYGGDIPIYIYMGFSICLSLSICVLVQGALNNEILNLNVDIKTSCDEKTIEDYLPMFASRQLDVIHLIKVANKRIGKIVGISSASSFITLLCTAFIMTGLRGGIGLGFFISNVAWSFTAFVILYYTTGMNSTIQEHISYTAEILVQDPSLLETRDASIRHMYRVMVDRCHNIDTSLYLLGCIPVKKNLMKIMLLIASNIVSITVILVKSTIFHDICSPTFISNSTK